MRSYHLVYFCTLYYSFIEEQGFHYFYISNISDAVLIPMSCMSFLLQRFFPYAQSKLITEHTGFDVRVGSNVNQNNIKGPILPYIIEIYSKEFNYEITSNKISSH